jgi:hypothetical protein
MATLLETYGLQCGEGWRSLYEPLTERCRAEGLPVLEIKEKLGQMRFQTKPGGSNELYEAILAAEVASAEICEICGAVGNRSTRKGLIMTRCPTHHDTPAVVGRTL